MFEKTPISLISLKKKVIAIDSFNILYQFLASIRQPDGTPLTDSNGEITSHLLGLFYRTTKLIENGIRLVFVFDGEHPKFKDATEEERSERKKKAKEKWEQAIEIGNTKDMLKYAQQTGRLNEHMISESKELIEALGFMSVDAPSEGEAQAALMAKKGVVYASASQDYDSLLFGSPKLIRNLSITGKRKVPGKNQYKIVEPEVIYLDDNLKRLGINRKQLIIMGILIGTDFNEGVKGIGPKTALKIVKEYKTEKEIFTYVVDKYKHTFNEHIDKIIEFFTNPPYKKVNIKFGKIDKDKIMELLCERHEFDDERVSKVLDKAIKAHEEIYGQSSISDWF